MPSFLYEQFYVNIEAEIPSQKTKKNKQKKNKLKPVSPTFCFSTKW